MITLKRGPEGKKQQREGFTALSSPLPYDPEETKLPVWNAGGRNDTPAFGWTRAPITNPPQYDSSTAISDDWKSTLVQDSDNFLLADPSDVEFQAFQNSFFR